MQQKHVITHPDQAGRTRSRHNQNYPEKYFRVKILFSNELQLLCVCYYRSLPEIVYLKSYREFIFFFFFFYNFTLPFILFLFTSVILGVVKIGGPWTRSIFLWLYFLFRQYSKLAPLFLSFKNMMLK